MDIDVEKIIPENKAWTGNFLSIIYLFGGTIGGYLDAAASCLIMSMVNFFCLLKGLDDQNKYDPEFIGLLNDTVPVFGKIQEKIPLFSMISNFFNQAEEKKEMTKLMVMFEYSFFNVKALGSFFVLLILICVGGGFLSWGFSKISKKSKSLQKIAKKLFKIFVLSAPLAIFISNIQFYFLFTCFTFIKGPLYFSK